MTKNPEKLIDALRLVFLELTAEIMRLKTELVVINRPKTEAKIEQQPEIEEDKSRVYTLEEARLLVGISRNSIYAAVKRGDIPSVRIGNSYRVPKTKLHQMLNGHDGET